MSMLYYGDKRETLSRRDLRCARSYHTVACLYKINLGIGLLLLSVPEVLRDSFRVSGSAMGAPPWRQSLILPNRVAGSSTSAKPIQFTTYQFRALFLDIFILSDSGVLPQKGVAEG